MGFERDIIIFLQSFSTPFLDGVFKVMAYFFDYPLVIVLGVLLFLFKKYRVGVYFLLLEGIGALVQIALKSLISRPRPFLTYAEINNVLEASNSSFPSGHSITCMVAVVVLWTLVNEQGWSKLKKNFAKVGLIIACVLCGINRMYLGQHYLTDVLAGFAISLIIGVFVIKFCYKKKATA